MWFLQCHTALYIKEQVKEALDKFGVSVNQILSVTTDNGRNVIKSVDILDGDIEDRGYSEIAFSSTSPQSDSSDVRSPDNISLQSNAPASAVPSTSTSTSSRNEQTNQIETNDDDLSIIGIDCETIEIDISLSDDEENQLNMYDNDSMSEDDATTLMHDLLGDWCVDQDQKTMIQSKLEVHISEGLFTFPFNLTIIMM